MTVRVGFCTLGCKANQADTIALKDALTRELGAVDFVGARDAADVVIVNSCTVTHTADADARQWVRRARRESPNAEIIVTGCYAQTDRAALEAMPEVNHVVGNVHKTQISSLVAAVLRGEDPDSAFVRAGHRDWNPTLRDAAAIRALPEGRSRPFLKVQDGCNYVCSFCIIPQARGASRSIPIDEVVAQARRYEALGAREIVLTGIHLGHWGRDLPERRSFGDMLSELLQRTDTARLRISSLEPNEVDSQVLDLVASHGRVCQHLHVPLQSGSDAILAGMRRVYRTPWYRRIANRYRGHVPRGAWGIDVMVGFPGEDDDAFETTRRFLEELDFTYLHVFPYSPRRGTPAAGMPGQVPPKEKRHRSRTLVALSEARRAAHLRASVGECGRVLVEDRRVRARLRGFTSNYVPVMLDGPDTLMGEMVAVEIVDVDGEHAIGRPL